jgi:hypothetical protein
MSFDNLPKSWHQVTLEQYKELNTVVIGDEYDSKIDVLIEQIAILLDTSADDPIIENIEIDELAEIGSRLQWLSIAPKHNYSQELVIEKQSFMFKPFNQLTLGEFIDIEYWISKGFDHIENICAVFYRQYENDKWGNLIYEPYIFDVEKRKLIFLKATINKIFGVINAYLEWRADFMKQYEALFEVNDWDKIDDEQELDPHELAELKKEIEQEKKLASWSWERILWDLSGNNIANYEDVFNSSLILAFNTLSMRKMLNV